MFSEVAKKCFEVLMSVKFKKSFSIVLFLNRNYECGMHVESGQWFKRIMLSQLYLKILPSIYIFKDCNALSLSSFVRNLVRM